MPITGSSPVSVGVLSMRKRPIIYSGQIADHILWMALGVSSVGQLHHTHLNVYHILCIYYTLTYLPDKVGVTRPQVSK